MIELPSGTVIAHKYRVDKRLGKGGMGSVWLGKHLALDALIAIKFMSAHMMDDPKARARFEREAKAAARIRSSHVVHIYDHGIHETVPFIVMEYLEGEDLSQKLRREGRLELEICVRLCVEIVKGLHHAHQEGLIHRDLKPSNIFLSRPDGGMAKIIDFGIAKPIKPLTAGDPELKTDSSVLVGSPWYMSPEQVRSKPIDARSDNWTLATVLYQALTGRLPFADHNVGRLLLAICTDPIPPPSTYRPELGPEIDGFFEKAFSREKEGRHADVRAFARAFCDAAGQASHIVNRDSLFDQSDEHEAETAEWQKPDDELSTASTRLDMMNQVRQKARRQRGLSLGLVGFGFVLAIVILLSGRWNEVADAPNSATDAAVEGSRVGAPQRPVNAAMPEGSAVAVSDAPSAQAAAAQSSSTSVARSAEPPDEASQRGKQRPDDRKTAGTRAMATSKPRARGPAPAKTAPLAAPSASGPDLGYQ